MPPSASRGSVHEVDLLGLDIGAVMGLEVDATPLLFGMVRGISPPGGSGTLPTLVSESPLSPSVLYRRDGGFRPHPLSGRLMMCSGWGTSLWSDICGFECVDILLGASQPCPADSYPRNKTEASVTQTVASVLEPPGAVNSTNGLTREVRGGLKPNNGTLNGH